jgi:integrase
MAGFRNGLKKVGDTWHFCFTINRKQFHGSTRAHDLQTAKKVLEEKRREAILGKALPPPTMLTVAELVEDWLHARRASASEKHIQSVELMTRLWVLPRIGKLAINTVTTGVILEVRAKLLEAGRSVATANHLLRVMKLLWNHAVAAGFIDLVPFKVKMLRAQRKPRPTVPASRVPEFMAAVRAQSQSPQVAVMLMVMLGLGLREAEVLGMRWLWLNLDQHTYTVGKAKGKEARVLPVPTWLWNELLTMPKTLNGLVFPGETGKPHHPHFCRKVLARVCKEMGLVGVTQHRLRSTFASLHAETGTPITEIQGMLGHKNILTTMLYVETSLDAKRKAQDALTQRLGLAQVPLSASASS